MVFLRLILLVSITLFCHPVFASICVNVSVSHDMLGTIVRSDTLAQGYKFIFRDNHFSDYRLFYANNNVELATQIKNMAVNSCSVVLGLSTSRECLIAGDFLKKNKMVGLSPGCAHDDVGKFYPYLFTGATSLSTVEGRVVDYVKRIPNLGKIFIIYQPTCVYSEEEKVQFMKKFSKVVIAVPVSADGKFDLSRFSYKQDEPINLIFFTYLLPSVKILIELSNHQLINKNVQIVGNASWDIDFSLFASLKPVLAKARSVVIVDIINWKKVKHSIFCKIFRKRFNREPLNIEILNYDITRFALKCYKKSLVNNKYNIDRFQHCITHTKYHGVSGTFSFGNHSSFSDRSEYLTNLLDQI